MIVAFFVRLSKNFPCPVSILFGSENLGKKALKPFALRVVEKSVPAARPRLFGLHP